MDETYLGVIEALGFKFAPRNWSYCAGTLIAIAQNQALFALLSDQFGGDSRTVFGLPDLRGRVPMGQFEGPGLPDRIIGQKIGAEVLQMTQAHLPAHTHSHSYSGGTPGSDASFSVATDPAKKQIPAAGDYIAPAANNFGALQDNTFISPSDVTAVVELGGVSGGTSGGFNPSLLSIHESGGGNPFPLVQPSQVINFCICVQGLFPSRS